MNNPSTNHEGTKPRRANHEGTKPIIRDDGRWEAKVRLPGGRKSFYGKSETEVRRKVREAVRMAERGIPLPDERLTVAKYLTDWLESKRQSVRPKTWERYKEIVTLHLIPGVGRIRIAQLAPSQLDAFHNAKLAANNPKLSPRTVQHMRAVMRTALEDALRDEIVIRNAAKLSKPIKLEEEERPILTPAMARQFLDGIAGDRLEALYVLALCTGMREGEILALQWDDDNVNLETGRIQVKATLHYLHGQFTFDPPKTKRSRRPVDLPQLAIAALKAHKAKQNEERLRLGAVWDDSYNLVFCNGIGRPIEATNFLKRSFYPLLEKAGLPKMHFHDLRHTAISLLLADGNYADLVAKIVGHRDGGFTHQKYGHAITGTQTRATETMDRLLRGKGRQ